MSTTNDETKKAIKNKTIKNMKALKIYKKEYDPLIDIYAELQTQYSILTKEFIESGYNYEVETIQGGAKKAPIVATLEALRKDILAYSDRLCLNPKSIENVTAENDKKSKLAKALSELNKNDSS